MAIQNVDPRVRNRPADGLHDTTVLTVAPDIKAAGGVLKSAGRDEFDLVIVYAELTEPELGADTAPPEVTFAKEVKAGNTIVIVTTEDLDLFDLLREEGELVTIDTDDLTSEVDDVVGPLVTEYSAQQF